jgi:hypothetical protein
MTDRAYWFHQDALRARAAVAAQQPSTANGHRARRLALVAFVDYARAGTEWAVSGRDRVRHRCTASIEAARAAADHARTGNRLLVTAAKLLN